MNRFILVDGLPYLYADGKVFAVRWDNEGFTVGAEVKMASVPSVTYPELAIKAKCKTIDSIGKKAAQKTEEGFDAMTLDELKDYAKKAGIKLGSARTKEAIIEVIVEALI